MKQTVHIEADFDKPELLKSMVEKLVMKPNHSAYHPEKVSKGHESLDISSTEAYVCGTISIDEVGNIIRSPFDSSFLFTCTKGRKNLFEVTWSSSLS